MTPKPIALAVHKACLQIGWEWYQKHNPTGVGHVGA